MIYLPTILILTLAASLIVAFIFNPVFAVSFMKPEGAEYEEPKKGLFKKWWFWTAIIFALLLHLAGSHGIANFLLFLMLLTILNRFLFRDIIHSFQTKLLPRLMNNYEQLLRWVLKGYRPVWMLVTLFLLFPLSVGLLMLRGNKSTFFPSGDPNFIYVYLKMPVGTDIKTTDSVTHVLENRVYKVLEKEQPGTEGSIVESIITNVANSANNPRSNNRSIQPNLGRIQVSFVEYAHRHGKHTLPYLTDIEMN